MASFLVREAIDGHAEMHFKLKAADSDAAEVPAVWLGINRGNSRMSHFIDRENLATEVICRCRESAASLENQYFEDEFQD